MHALRADLGIAAVLSFFVPEDFNAGRIEPVLPDWSLGMLNIYAMYPQRRFLPAKVRLFMDALRAGFGGESDKDPWWPRGL